ncbi:phospholipase D-like domain-containing protein [Sphingomonas solaris]|uniref:Phospholipase D n=1 Tax=Alterirhizorhabdus solaris TaxID=2529389 RepID=A0A558QX12_9SPHN|nr:phospholipase D-like domain-containing protein [Sphingomonas solaris]TVV71670.1 phospholipase [Sphingomonas solaris]
MSDHDPAAAAASILVPGENVWSVDRATRAAVVIDADDYFAAARAAMMRAEQRIMLIGWDFDGRIRLGGEKGDPSAPDEIGPLILWLVERNPALEVYLLRWDLGAIRTLFRGTTIFTFLKWMRHKRIHTRLDGAHPPGASHHQKIVVIDDSFAFCGGIDMTGDRWDTRHHCDDEPQRKRPNGKPYPPWHDATTAIEGPAAARLGELARDRWRISGGGTLAPIEASDDVWPPSLDPQFRDVDIAISRSRPTLPDLEPIREIERLYLDMIGAARRFIYAESQYFASRRIAEAIARRLDEPDGPEIVIVNPLTANGWLEPIAMDSARARLFEALRRRDPHKRLRLYHPVTKGGEPIYVHAKIMIVDEEMLRVGSSNMNNRSLRLDTECDVTIERACSANGACRPAIRAIRDGLIAEHLDVAPDEVARRIDASGSIIATIEALRGSGRTLEPYEIPDLSAVETWLADNEVLDPEGPEEMFEALGKRGLFRRARNRRAARKALRKPPA